MKQKKSFSQMFVITLATVLLLVMIVALFFVIPAAGRIYHKVKFCLDDGTVLQTVRVEDGKTAKYKGDLPTQDADSRYTYTFQCWVGEDRVEIVDLSEVKEDMTVYAYFKKEWIKYSLTIPENVSVTKDGTPLTEESAIYYGDEIVISYTETVGHHKTIFKVNGEDVDNGTTITVRGNVEIVYEEELSEESGD